MILKIKSIFLFLFIFSGYSYSNTNISTDNKTPQEPVSHFSMGNNSQSLGNKSTAIGENSQARELHSVAIGYNAVATDPNTVSFGNEAENQTARLVNISEGKKFTDAVNLKQAKTLIDKNYRLTNSALNQMKSSLNHNLSQVKNEINDMGEYVKKRQATITDAIGELDKNIISLEKKMFAGIASNVAISSIPYLPNQQFSTGIGISSYRSGTAIAGGMQYAPNNNMGFRLNTSINTEHEIILGGGFAYGW